MKPKRSSGDEFSTGASSSASPVTHETYTHGHARATLRQHGKRTADEAAAFIHSRCGFGPKGRLTWQ
jgi:hypothetical protein